MSRILGAVHRKIYRAKLQQTLPILPISRMKLTVGLLDLSNKQVQMPKSPLLRIVVVLRSMYLDSLVIE